MSSVTTSKNGFVTEDITFHGARHQSEIIKELGLDTSELNEEDVEAPKSLTNEQLKAFYVDCLNSTKDLDKKRAYTRTIHLIEENEVMKSKLRTYVLRELEASRAEETVDDIQE